MPSFAIDASSYRKDTIHPLRWGYQLRNNAAPSSIIIHTTSNRRATQFATEATFLRDSPDVSAHFLIGKDGYIVQFLAPEKYQAWHAGNCMPAYLNVKSIGIEHHVSVGEAWTDVQHEACTWLVRELMTAYRIPPALIETHRAVALPPGRKVDPAGWNDANFYAWRNTLVPALPETKTYTVKHRYVTERMEDNGPPYVRELISGESIVVDKWYANHRVHLADGSGFADLDDLDAL